MISANSERRTGLSWQGVIDGDETLISGVNYLYGNSASGFNEANGKLAIGGRCGESCVSTLVISSARARDLDRKQFRVAMER